MSNSVILATRKGVITLVLHGNTWRVIASEFPGIATSYAFRHPYSKVLWAALDTDHWGAKLQRSLDEGKTWEEVEMPKYPSGAEASEGVPATLSYIWQIAAGHAEQPERVYLGTEPGGLFQSDDNGDSFKLVAGLWEHPTRDQWFGGGRDHPGLHSVIVDRRDPKRILTGISVGGVYASSDDGGTWSPSNKGLIPDYLPNPQAEVGHDPHLLAASPSDPDVLWQQNHCGIFRSTDGAKNWQKISEDHGPADFGFAIALDENDAETAWVVPAISDEVRMAVDGAMCVSRTEDGGVSWQHFRTGLPQENVYDFTFRHALDISGERLMFGTSTGNLFVSEDRGETWNCISNYFPPIYSVRFI